MENEKYVEAITFITDLHFMMHAKYFTGLIMSQIARMVVDIGSAKGTMIQAIALDEEKMDRVDDIRFKGADEGRTVLSKF